MTPQEVVEITKEAIWILVVVSAPCMVAALVVGLIISLLQALTQIQEMTLTFVPKVLAMLLTLALAMPFMLQTLTDFTHRLHERIIHIE